MHGEKQMISRTMDNVNLGVSRSRLSVCIPVFAFLFIAVAPFASARAKPKSDEVVDRDYLSALAAANRFLQAWQNQDHEAGLMMISDSARQRVSEDRLEEFFSPEPGAAFEISRGKKLRAARYAFPVALLEFVPDGEGHRIHRRLSRIVVVKTGKHDWDIDRLP
jgi:hypothetical protein